METLQDTFPNKFIFVLQHLLESKCNKAIPF